MLVGPRSAPSAARALARALIALGLAAVSCAEPSIESTAVALDAPDSSLPSNVDLLFAIDDSSGMPGMQEKLADQIPRILQTLESLPRAPNLHVAVVSSDLGAPGDSPALTGCTSVGDEGVFQAKAHGNCSDTTLTAAAAFVSDVDGVRNYLAPEISTVVQCIVPLGGQGCAFGHTLASVARALGADGSPAPAANAGFLRADATLAIIILSDEDDCSAPANTVLYSLNNGHQNLTNALGPIAHYRCNQFGHLCLDAHAPGAAIPPPEVPPADAQGTSSAPTFDLAQCQSNDTDGLLTPVGTLVGGLKALKSDPDRQIVVGAIVAPATPYTVAWAPAPTGTDTTPGELWPEVEHSCDETINDGSFGDPAVRIAQFVRAFGANGTIVSICDSSYASVIRPLVDQIAPDDQTTIPTDGGSDGEGGSGLEGDAGDAGMVDLDAGADGTGTTGAGGSAGAGAGGVGASGETDGSVVVLTDGLRNGCGCEVGRDGAGGQSGEFLLIFLAVARRRRARGVES
ncbi:MAG TPA: hypothetical protein VH853_07485 [Polyangia bacterium]|jgi:hypothetical protein|nr:hypothetical protein [Polyangia bacterium]